MVNKRAFLALMLATTLAGSASATLAADRSAPQPSRIQLATSHAPQPSGAMEALFFVGDRLLSILQSVRGVGMAKLPRVGSGYQVYGIQDGPEGADPLGVKDNGLRRTDPPAPANTPVP